MTGDPGAVRRVRPVRLLTTGGTIAMAGAGGAAPELGADELLASTPGLDRVAATALMNRPSAHLTLDDQLLIGRTARDLAREGSGVVVTHGTDTLEESALLSDLLNDAEAPVVFTGAIRPASAPGADGPANLADAVAVAGSGAAAGLGTLVVFGGEIHHARLVRKSDSTSPLAFSSPQGGSIGRVVEGRPSFHGAVARSAAVDPPRLDRRVVVVPALSGDDGTHARALMTTEPDGVVLGTLGAGHIKPALLALWAPYARTLPVVAHGRPERGTIVRGTYGYDASERDLRAAGVIAAGLLSPQAIRIKLIALLSAGLDLAAVRERFAQDDG